MRALVIGMVLLAATSASAKCGFDRIDCYAAGETFGGKKLFAFTNPEEFYDKLCVKVPRGALSTETEGVEELVWPFGEGWCHGVIYK